ACAVESGPDAVPKKIGRDALEWRLTNAGRKGTKTLSGATLNHDGYADTLESLLRHPDYKAPLGKNQGRGVASGYWFNGGGESSAPVHVNQDGTGVRATRSPALRGRRARARRTARRA